VVPLVALGVTAASLVAVGLARNPPLPAVDLSATRAAAPVAWLRTHLAPGERVAPFGEDVLIPNTNVLLGLPSVALQDPMQSCRYQVFFAAANRPDRKPECGGQNQTVLRAPNVRALQLLAAPYLVASETSATSGAVEGAPGLRPVYRDGHVSVYEADGVLPRAYVASRVRTFPRDDPAVFPAVFDPAFDPRDTVALEVGRERRAVPGAWPPAPACDAGAPWLARLGSASEDTQRGGSAAIVDERPARVRVRASSPAAGVLVLLDNDRPGWQAYVDGVPAPICRANALFRAVPLPPGDHDVTFVYAPLSFFAGLACATVALAAALTLLAWPRRGSAHRGRTDGVAAAGWVMLVAQSVLLLGFSPLLHFHSG
jgi:hypothetical protein